MVDHRVAIDTYINTGPIANAKWRGMGQLMCHMADVLVFSDVIPDSRSVLLGNCTTPILLLMTNRIDVAVADKKNYYKFMNEVVQRPYVWFVVNNPYEAAYAGSKGVILPPERTQLLRPVGVTLLEKPPPEAAAARSKLVALIEHPGKPLLEITFIQPWLKERNLMEYVQVYGKIYGGPVVLSQHKAVISIPYQASVMKMYEGMVQGTVFAVPTPRFFKELVMDTYNGTMMEFCCRAWVKDHPEDWMEVVDWYHKDFIDGHAMFDSWDELEQLIKGEGKYTPEFLADKKATSKRLMLASRKVSLDGYRDLVEKMERQSCESLHRADMWPPPYANAWKRPERGW
ncbi:hypothetical protein HYH03_017506 [Edaphochlamys debaryana]|uniref:Uncharacterized protein n=1 Tax=Edaphochlamys debaryana TaxID=47281 RepID=A0A836BQI4_9CHLO|nr:hypothetical protein HYH03_017506 [Edaphochlamys debaryana]|eukprot:KAG2483628.1 hypothetical protein HYH03_017506 [Edaphochlamys debaryana]